MSGIVTPRELPADASPDLPRGPDLGRVVNLDATRQQYGGDVVDLIAEGFSHGDELSYRVLCDIRERDGFGWREFHQALDGGIASLDDPPASLQALFSEGERVPAWVDWEQLRRGAIAYWRPGPIVPLALTADIAQGFKSYGSMKPIIFTGRLIDEQRVGRRLIETLRYIATVTTPDAMRRDSDGWKYSMRLRMLHASVRYGCMRAEAWDWADWGLPVNDSDNLAAPLEFSVGVVDMLATAGLVLEAQEVEDIVALWRYIAFVLGTPEHLLMSSAADARVKLAITDALNHTPDDTNRLLLHSLVDYASREGIGYEPFPAFVAKRLTPTRRKALIYGLMYAWNSDEVARDMRIPRNRYRHVLPAIRPLVRAQDRLAARSHEARERACRQMLADFSPVTTVARDEAPLADPDETVTNINRRRDKLAGLFDR